MMKVRFFNTAVILAAASAAVVMLLTLFGVLKLHRIPTSGMSPTVQPGDFVFSTGGFLASSDYKRGQIVIFRPPLSPDKRYIQRIVAMQGDRVELIDNCLAVNGVVLKSPEGVVAMRPPATHRVPELRKPDYYPLTLPEGQVFLMGDNYGNSLDSRYFGPVWMKEITHVPRSIAFPPSRSGPLE